VSKGVRGWIGRLKPPSGHRGDRAFEHIERGMLRGEAYVLGPGPPARILQFRR
jgi:hypothetical protein